MDVRPPKPDEMSEEPALARPEPAEGVPESVAVGFCRLCGMPRNPAFPECPACAARIAASASKSLPDLQDHGRALRSVVGLYLALLATSALGIMLAQNEVQADFLVEIADTAIVLLWVIKDRVVVWPALKRAGSKKWYALALLLAPGTFLLAETCVRFFHSFVGVQTIEVARPLLDTGYGFGWIVLVGCVQPAVIEELAFRGILFGRMERSVSPSQAVLLSALLFAILHLSIPSFGHLAVIGLALGYLRWKSGSVYPCMLMHFAHNATVIAAEFL